MPSTNGVHPDPIREEQFSSELILKRAGRLPLSQLERLLRDLTTLRDSNVVLGWKMTNRDSLRVLVDMIEGMIARRKGDKSYVDPLVRHRLPLKPVSPAGARLLRAWRDNGWKAPQIDLARERETWL